MTAATYLPSGPLTSLALGNGLAETRSFDSRYFPAGITVPGRLDWTYSTDTIGNILEIADTGGGGDRTYTYQDVHYFLTSGTGPWGSLAFTYDKIGNRLSETRDAGGSPQNRPYAYPASPSGGNLPKLASITDPAGDRLERFFFDDAGNQTYRATQTAKHRLSYDALGRMSQIKTDSDETAGALVTLAYDGRSFLKEAARSPFPGQPATVTTNPTYSSDGLLMHKATSEVLGPDDPRGEGTATSDTYVLYFAGRPVGILENETVTDLDGGTSSSSTLTYLTTDHLGTPVLATDETGTTTWAGGFAPFGADWQAETGTGASDAGVFLRFPGQWDDPAWGGAGTAGTSASDPGFYYNVHRWYEPGTGRYGRVDPLVRFSELPDYYVYAGAEPLTSIDPLGLLRVDCESCEKIQRARENVAKRIFLLRTTGTAIDPSGTNVPTAVTNCAEIRVGSASLTDTFTQRQEGRFPESPCVFLCTGVHERVHRRACTQLGASVYNGLTESERELPAYNEQLKCLLAACSWQQLRPYPSGSNSMRSRTVQLVVVVLACLTFPALSCFRDTATQRSGSTPRGQRTDVFGASESRGPSPEIDALEIPRLEYEPDMLAVLVASIQATVGGRAIEVRYKVLEDGSVRDCSVVRVGGSEDLISELSANDRDRLCRAVELRRYAAPPEMLTVSFQFGTPAYG